MKVLSVSIGSRYEQRLRVRCTFEERNERCPRRATFRVISAQLSSQADITLCGQHLFPELTRLDLMDPVLIGIVRRRWNAGRVAH